MVEDVALWAQAWHHAYLKDKWWSVNSEFKLQTQKSKIRLLRT